MSQRGGNWAFLFSVYGADVQFDSLSVFSSRVAKVKIAILVYSVQLSTDNIIIKAAVAQWLK